MTLRCHRVFYVSGCVYVTSFPLRSLPIPWTQWERVEWRAVCESVYVFGTKIQGYRGNFFLTVQKASKQPQQWLQFINTFMHTIVLFSVVVGGGFFTVQTSDAPMLSHQQLYGITTAFFHLSNKHYCQLTSVQLASSSLRCRFLIDYLRGRFTCD